MKQDRRLVDTQPLPHRRRPIDELLDQGTQLPDLREDAVESFMKLAIFRRKLDDVGHAQDIAHRGGI